MYTTEEMRNPGQYRCAQCYTNCPTKKIFDLHSTMCKFIHTSGYENSIDRFYSKIELPSQEAQLHYIFHLTKKFQDLEEKLAKIQKSIIPLCRRQVGEYLESLAPPDQIYSDWCQSIQITDETLEHLLKTDLKTGIKSVLENLIDDDHQEIPIRAFTQKSNIFYIYDHNSEWRKMTSEEFVKLVEKLEHKFLKKYMSWANDHFDELHSSQQGEERAVLYMAKVNGVKQGTSESRISEIKRWLFMKMAVSLKQVIV